MSWFTPTPRDDDTERADHLTRAELSAAESLRGEMLRAVAGDQRAVEVEERADLGVAGARLDLGDRAGQTQLAAHDALRSAAGLFWAGCLAAFFFDADFAPFFFALGFASAGGGASNTSANPRSRQSANSSASEIASVS